MFSSNSIPFHRLEGVRLALYTPEEVKKLSVKKITNTETFDALLHPSYGGLYDPCLGPTDKDDLCGTCAKNSIHCPGHVGHIELPLPTYHPLFLKVILQILRATCFNCRQLLINRAAKHLFLSQMKVLDYGLIAATKELEEVAQTSLKTSAESDSAGRDQEACIRAVDTYKNSVLQGLDKKEAKSKSVVKSVTDLRHCIVKDFMKTYMVNRKRYCPYCKAPSRDVRCEYNSRIFLKALSNREARKWAATKIVQVELEKRTVIKEEDGAEVNGHDHQEIEPKGGENELPSKDEVLLSSKQTYLSPIEVKEHMTQVWMADGDVLNALLGGYPSPSAIRRSASANMFFIDILPVPPSRFRPLSFMDEKRFENPQTANLNNIMKSCVLVQDCLKELNKKTSQDQEVAELQEGSGQRRKSKGRAALVASGKTPAERLQNAWLKLQSDVNALMDSDLDKLSTDKNPGVRQILEKKEGLFRKHMMGKRVDYAARSVISPDPYINVDEIGIPEVFAVKLTYPQPVTAWNVKELRQAVINGPQVHPGATLVEHEDGKKTLLSATDANQRQAIAKRLLTPSMDGNKGTTMNCKKVYRHLKNGDVLLLNRQPTLHRPSIMAHKARVLPNEKTIRLHYANCKSYNADFDGDEMNAHFPQNELARSEAYNLASTNFHYLVPKDGTPLSGLLQDHMVSGVRMTVRGTMFNKLDYQQLVYSALSYRHDIIKLLKPCIMKPRELWSGKQVVSTVLQNLIPKYSKRLNLSGRAKITGKNWITRKPKRHFTNNPTIQGDDMSEAEVIIREGELMCGVLDKGHYGPTPFGLVHCCYELYGGVMAGHLLSSLARLFTSYLQIHGFTLGVEDILVTASADKKRRKFISKGRESGTEAAQLAMGLPDECERSVLEEKLQVAHHSKDENDMKELDLQMKRKTDHFQDLINKVCIPLGLHKRFPANNLQLMVNSGAKGSTVNCMQISCLLGQIELEGRRPPIMPSGRSLPSFLPYDTSPRAGGFVDGRFLTGIRPQEYFFHCMAGREGLVDTAVKTSRSGYLQRCLIKHLEGLQVSYDLSVRDSDGSLLQFYYGEDGLDICKTPFLSENQYPFMASNITALLHQLNPKVLVPHLDSSQSDKQNMKIAKWRTKHRESNIRSSPFLRFAKEHAEEVKKTSSCRPREFGRSKADMRLFEMWHSTPPPVRSSFARKCRPCPDPVLCKLRPDRHFGSLSEKFIDSLTSYSDKNPHKCITDESGKLPPAKFRSLMFLKAYRALAEPGEAVGLLAAQMECLPFVPTNRRRFLFKFLLINGANTPSIGEPSTQMTLNTFHFAGRGDMNVTLGIPRLREILMTASANIKTPTMDIPLKPGKKVLKKAKQLQQQFTRVHLSQVLRSVDVWESLSSKESGTRCRMYRVRFEFLPEETYEDKFFTRPALVLQHVERVFVKKVISSIQKTMRIKENLSMLDSGQDGAEEPANLDRGGEPVDEDDDNAELSDEEQADGDAAELKQRQRREQHVSYEAPDYDEEEIERELGDSGQSEDEGDDEMTSTVGGDDTSSVTTASEFSRRSPSSNSEKVKQNRVRAVIGSDTRVARYNYDVNNELWCEVTLKFPVTQWKVRVSSVIEKLARQSVVYETPGIKRCFMAEENGCSLLRTDGVNVQAVWRYPEILAVDKLYTNDIHAVADTYGIEAAAQVIKKEIRNVFGAYGIRVDLRHLSLVSDYMTNEGKIKAFNRIGIESNASPFQKMSFETTTHFLRGAVISGDTEKLVSPSSRLVVGRVVGSGTGCFDILQPLC